MNLLGKKQEDLQEAIGVAGSMDDFIDRVRAAFRRQFDGDPEYAYVENVFPDFVIVHTGDYITGLKWRVTMTAAEDSFTFAARDAWERVELQFVLAGTIPEEPPPAADNAMQESQFMRGLIESVNGRREAVIIVEGKAQSGKSYTLEALKTGIPIFSNVQVFADHPTLQQLREQPERSVREAVGRLGDAYIGKDRYGRHALKAPLLLSKAEEALLTKIDEGILGDLSINALGSGKRDAEGGVLVEAFVENPLTSVDLVTKAGAGGHIEIQESIKNMTPEVLKKLRPDLVQESIDQEIVQWIRESHMTAQDLQDQQEQIKVLLEENAKFFAQLRKNEARTKLAEVLGGELPEVVRERVTQHADPLIEDYATHGNSTTVEAITESFNKLLAAEREYIAKLVPHGRAVGGTDVTVSTAESLIEAFNGLLDEEEAKIAAGGRYNG